MEKQYVPPTTTAVDNSETDNDAQTEVDSEGQIERYSFIKYGKKLFNVSFKTDSGTNLANNG